MTYGGQEYPRSWSFTPKHLSLAAEAVEVGCGQRWPRAVHYLWRGRSDLQTMFPLEEPASYPALLAWVRVNMGRQFQASPILSAEAIALSEGNLRSGDPATDAVHLSWTAAALAALDWRSARTLSAVQRRTIASWYVAGGWAQLPKAEMPMTPPSLVELGLTQLQLAKLPRQARDGVNLCGYVRGEFGIGEDLRAMSASLDSMGIPHVILDAGRPGQAREEDHTLVARVRARPVYPVTIYCLTPVDTARLYLEQGPALFDGVYRIGSWAWELPEVPAVLDDVFDLVDEVWAHSRYSLAAFQVRARRPTYLMPPSVVLPEGVSAAPRLDDKPFTFIVPFDPNSYLARKNPLAAVQAFKAAFPSDNRDVDLLLRVNGVAEPCTAWTELTRAVQDDTRIRVLEGTLARRDALGLLAAADCLISPHRAEGFGRNIAEAIRLGVPVLATGFSGCLDFLDRRDRLPWSRRAIMGAEYPFGKGLWWAEPDPEGMVAAMGRVYRTAKRPAAIARRARLAESMAYHYGAAQAGIRYANRLKRIGLIVGQRPKMPI